MKVFSKIFAQKFLEWPKNLIFEGIFDFGNKKNNFAPAGIDPALLGAENFFSNFSKFLWKTASFQLREQL